jgi:putative tryptophan/tyrosine transport system substrate-binding protein
MGKKSLVVLLIGLALASVHLAEAQQPKRVPKIGYLSTGSATTDDPRIEAFRQGLRDLGHVEGKNINIDFRYAEGVAERLPELAKELVRLNVDVILTTRYSGGSGSKTSDHHDPYHLSRRGRSGCLWLCS